MQDNINRKINDAFASIDGIVPADPKPFLMTRINASLSNERQNSWSRIAAFIKRPAVAGASVLLLLLLNIAIFRAGNMQKNHGPKRVASSKYDFSINVSSMYDTENQEP